ncbi:MAG TPA: SCO family protein [Rhodanobacteraceae bacterium]|nr:SCO family protein [Rhodanobacteraceae bacterium]
MNIRHARFRHGLRAADKAHARRMAVIGLVACTVVAAANAIAGQPTHLRAPPHLLDKVGFVQKLGAQVPLQTTFRNAHGTQVRLGDLLDGKPTLLVPGYFSCINLCSIVRTGVANAVAASGLAPGKQFNVVLVSINPDDTPRTAATTQTNDAVGHRDAHVPRWHYLVGSRQASAALMRSIGFRYLFDKRNGQYDHDAGIVLLTPQGKVSQYLFGVKFAPETLRLGLVQASHGKIGNLVDHFLLLCCNYDPSTGRYSLVIHRVMQLLGTLTAVLLIGVIAYLRHREKRARKGESA